jgi:hypothetical protein
MEHRINGLEDLIEILLDVPGKEWVHNVYDEIDRGAEERERAFKEFHITEEEVREAIEAFCWGERKYVHEVVDQFLCVLLDLDKMAETVDLLETDLYYPCDSDRADLLDDSEEGEGEYQPDWMISPQGAVHEQSAPCCDGGDCIDPTKPLRVRVADEMQARELSNMAIDAGFSVKGNYCDKNQLLVRPEEESSMWMDKRRENPADFVTDFFDRKPQVEAYLNFHSEEADMSDDELTEHPDREDDDSTEREIAEQFMEEGDWMMELFDKETVRIPVVVLHALRSQLELADEGVCEWTYDNTHCKWDTECGDGFSLLDPNDPTQHYTYCPGCGNPIEIVEDEGEPEYEVGDLVRYKGRDPLDNYIITGQHEAGCDDCGCYDSKHFSVLCSTGSSGYIPVDKQDNFEQLGAFEPTDEFFERVPDFTSGELVIEHMPDGHDRVALWPGTKPGDIDYGVVTSKGESRAFSGEMTERTGIIVSAEQLESIFLEE